MCSDTTSHVYTGKVTYLRLETNFEIFLKLNTCFPLIRIFIISTYSREISDHMYKDIH
jgi:hypothetical protein